MFGPETFQSQQRETSKADYLGHFVDVCRSEDPLRSHPPPWHWLSFISRRRNYSLPLRLFASLRFSGQLWERVLDWRAAALIRFTSLQWAALGMCTGFVVAAELAEVLGV